MMFRLLYTIMYAGAFMVAVQGPHALEVDSDTTGLVVKGRGEVSVFSPRPDEVWIVAPDDVRGTVTARTGWEVGWLQAPAPALRLKTPAAREWHVVNLPHAAFEVRVGRAVGDTPILPKQSMIVLKDGTVLGDGEMIPVASDDGLRFRVGTAGRWGVGVEDKAVVQGGVVAVNSLAAIEPAAGEEPIEMPAGAEIAVPATPGQTFGKKAPDNTVAKNGDGEVPMFGAEELKGVETPVAEHAAKVENLPATQLAMLDPRRVYVPGALVPFTLPQGYRLVEGQIVRVPTGKRMENLVNTDMALAEAESKVGSLLQDEPVEKVLGVRAAHEEAEPTEAPVEKAPEEATTPEEPTAEHKLLADEGHEAVAAEHGEGAVSVTDEVSGTAEPEEEPVTDGWLPATGRIKNYVPAVLKLQHEIARAETPQAAMAARRSLSQLYLAWRRPQEALVLNSLISPTLPVDDLLAGIALVATEHFDDATKRLDGVGGVWKDHAALWRAVAEEGSGASAAALDTWPAAHEALVKQYPLWLRDLATQSHAEAMLAVAPGLQAKAYIEEVGALRGNLTPAWERLRGLGLLAAKDRAGLEILAAAAEQTKDMHTAYLAKYDFVQALRARKELENRQMINYLEALRYNWRGDELEQKVLRELGELYVAREDYRTGLERWRTLIQAYPAYPAMGQLTTEMSKAVEAVFNPEGTVTYAPLEYLGLYYDFRELLPDDARGDAINEQVANVLVQEGLYDRALPLLEQLLNFRTPPTALDRTRLALAYANAQRLNGAPQDALRTLDQYGAEVPNTVLKENWNIAEAETLLDLARPADALASLGKMNGPEARRLRLEAQWQNQNWPQVVEAADVILSAATDPKAIATNVDLQLALLRQSFAYSQLMEGEKIRHAQNRFADGLEKVPTIRDTMTALAGLNGVEGKVEASDRPLGRFAEALNGINQVANRMEATRAAHLAEKQEQREYNEKMDYMQLLPPPTL